MASSSLTINDIFIYFKQNECIVQNRELVHHFKHYLTHPISKDDARRKFKQFVNTLAHTRIENGVKYLELKTKYKDFSEYPQQFNYPHSPSAASPPYDSRNSIGIPAPPLPQINDNYQQSLKASPSPRQPPPYREPPPVTSSPSNSCDNISFGSMLSLQDTTPQPPPRRKSTIDRQKSLDNLETTPKKSHSENENSNDSSNNGEDNNKSEKVSVRERMEKFNRLATVDDEGGSPRQPKSAEKMRQKANKGVEEDDGASLSSLDLKKCMEWYVSMSKGDVQELVKLAKDEPRLVNRKDPFTAYSVLHWGAKRGNMEIIKIFAGRYKVDVNGRTNGGYTPLHLAAQFGHENIYELLVKAYRADETIRDYSGRLPIYYKKQNVEQKIHSKIKTRKKPSDKDLGFLRIGSLNVRVKKTTEAFSNFLGVGGGGSINPLDTMDDKVHKGWGSADNLNQENGPGKIIMKKKSKRPYSSGLNSMPGTPKQILRNANTQVVCANTNDSDSDSAAGFDSQWK